MSRTLCRIAGLGCALPGYELDQRGASELLKKHYAGRLRPGSIKMIERVFSHPSVKTRRFAFDSPQSVMDEDPDRRVRRFTEQSLALSSQAASRALAEAGLKPRDISAVIVNTCTGYICPGISTYLIEKMGFSRSVKAFDLVGGGCAGAIPNLELARALVSETPGSAALSVAVEICSCTFQMADDPGLIISNAIFGDGAAAAVVWDRPEGLEMVSARSRFAPEYRDDIRYVHKNGQLHNQLSPALPALAAETAGSLADELLEKNRLKRDDIKYWAVHPGGENVIAALEEKLGLEREKLKYTRKVLAGSGNMSSPTALFILDEIRRDGMAAGDMALMLAFGAGLAAHALLLRNS